MSNNRYIIEKIPKGKKIFVTKYNNRVKIIDENNETVYDMPKLSSEFCKKAPNDFCAIGIFDGNKTFFYDCMTYEEFRDKKCSLTLEERMFDLDYLLSKEGDSFKKADIIYDGDNYDKIQQIINNLKDECIVYNRKEFYKFDY